MTRAPSLSQQLRACMLVCCVMSGPQAVAQKSLRDPFVRPPGLALRPGSATDVGLVSPADGTVAPSGALNQAPTPEVKPELRAVVFDGPRSLVNLGGRILGVGESIDGYRLLNVEERGAVFAKDGARITITLDKGKSK